MSERNIKLEEKLTENIKKAWSNVEDNWDRGILLNSMAQLCRATHDEKNVQLLSEMVNQIADENTYKVLVENDCSNLLLGSACYILAEVTKNDKYSNIAKNLACQFDKQPRSEKGYFIDKDGCEHLCASYCTQPFYMYYETMDGGKEKYNDIMQQYNALFDNLYTAEKNSISNNFENIAYFCASLIDTMEVMAQTLYEIFDKLKTYYRDSVKALMEAYDDSNDLRDCDLMLAYAILKGCRMKALNTEKYEKYGMNIFNKMIIEIENNGAYTSPMMAGAGVLCYSESIKNREYQDYGRSNGGVLWS